MATKAQAEKVLAATGIILDEVQEHNSGSYGFFAMIDAPEGYYLNSTGLHMAGVQGWSKPEFWDCVIEDAQPGITACADGGCDSCDN